jgi:hypothetical protein
MYLDNNILYTSKAIIIFQKGIWCLKGGFVPSFISNIHIMITFSDGPSTMWLWPCYIILMSCLRRICKVVKYLTGLWTQIILRQMILFSQHTTLHCAMPPTFKHLSLSLLANIQVIKQINTFYIHIFVHLYLSLPTTMHPSSCHIFI